MKKLLLKIARLPALGKLAGWCIAHLSRVLPLKIAAENGHCIAFHHPVPSYSTHLLIMLKAQARDVSCIGADQYAQITDAARASVRALNLAAPHIMLWTNGGRFQEVRQLHFHLFPSDIDREKDLREVRAFSVGRTAVRECCRKGSASPDLLIMDADDAEFFSVFPLLMTEYGLEARGYSVFQDLSRPGRFYIRMG